jgi:thiol-disulfide isomerase/thioredoxin
MKTLLIFAVMLFGSMYVSAQTEHAPIQQKELNYKNWNYKSARGDGEVNLRDFTKNKKLVMVVYFAPWCPGWKREAPFVQKMYEKYRANGFDVVGVGEYDTVDAMKKNLDDLKITFPVVYESDSTAAKQKTPHYEYRKLVGDNRNWGTPWNIFLEPAGLEKKGDVLLKKAAIVSGELIESETEKYIREKLGLPAEEKKTLTAENKTIEACEPEKKILSLKKPE